MKKLFTIIFLIVTMLIPIKAFALEKDGNNIPDCTVSITMKTPDKETYMSKISFSVYCVAELTDIDAYSFNITTDFIQSGVIPKDIAESKNVAGTLYKYVSQKNIIEDSILTDNNGVAKYKCKAGAYLIVPDKMPTSSAYKTSEPFVVMIPARDAETGKIIYDIQCSPKVEVNHVATTEKNQSTHNYDKSTTHKNLEVSKKLPVTGMVQWPIPLFATVGLFLFTLGWVELYLRKKHE